MMFKQLIKSLIPNGLKYRIKMGSEIVSFAKQMEEIEKSQLASAYLVGTPIHTNLGDHLITLAEYWFLNLVNPMCKIQEIPTEMFQVYKKRLKKAIPANIPIYINGGGWMGNLWPNEELLLQEIIENFCDHKIVIFPQTIYFERGKKPYEELIKSANAIYCKCKDIILCTRDRQSYEFASKNYKNLNILLVPDIALAYYDLAPKNIGNKKIVGYCLRADRESYINEKHIKQIKDIFRKLGYISKDVSTICKKRVPTWNRNKIVHKCLEDFAECSFVVTDRLHGMIFSFLTQTPCIVLDNKTKKVSGVYNEWLKDSSTICPIFGDINFQVIENFILSKTQKKYMDNLALYDKFNELRMKINE